MNNRGGGEGINIFNQKMYKKSTNFQEKKLIQTLIFPVFIHRFPHGKKKYIHIENLPRFLIVPRKIAKILPLFTVLENYIYNHSWKIIFSKINY